MLYEAQGIRRFIIVCGYTDLRKGITGLSQLIEGRCHLDLFEEDVLPQISMTMMILIDTRSNEG